MHQSFLFKIIITIVIIVRFSWWSKAGRQNPGFRRMSPQLSSETLASYWPTHPAGIEPVRAHKMAGEWSRTHVKNFIQKVDQAKVARSAQTVSELSRPNDSADCRTAHRRSLLYSILLYKPWYFTKFENAQQKVKLARCTATVTPQSSVSLILKKWIPDTKLTKPQVPDTRLVAKPKRRRA